MRFWIIVWVLVSVVFWNCKKDKEETPLPFESIVGRWRADAVENTVNGQKVWEKVLYTDPYYFSFRDDGVILDSRGLPACCSPDSLKVNGVAFKIIPQSGLPDNPACAYVDCVGCPSWDIQQNGDEIIISYCYGVQRAKFIRE
ncbi:hypothetical protein DYBT9275_02364 [Dyadobacter sp. CECT 9275]|uniref:Lipocalin-like domain-containing protein n=1 Tax=Dyadobacter helix TaxID=2822344 RepID=A0A916JBP6_9BACT|nr:hypothetical protein [Dyadobacter sp. CECT 9275]CAG5000003.1 hypothetical protein DYBT9275_02364 [Dyadobacter sp. CECT 9275]